MCNLCISSLLLAPACLAQRSYFRRLGGRFGGVGFLSFFLSAPPSPHHGRVVVRIMDYMLSPFSAQWHQPKFQSWKRSHVHETLTPPTPPPLPTHGQKICFSSKSKKKTRTGPLLSVRIVFFFFFFQSICHVFVVAIGLPGHSTFDIRH